jgi:hypothetical protein
VAMAARTETRKKEGYWNGGYLTDFIFVIMILQNDTYLVVLSYSFTLRPSVSLSCLLSLMHSSV